MRAEVPHLPRRPALHAAPGEISWDGGHRLWCWGEGVDRLSALLRSFACEAELIAIGNEFVRPGGQEHLHRRQLMLHLRSTVL